MLKSISEFSNWKIMMKAYFKFTEHTLWESIAKGPHIPKTANADGLVPIVDPDLYSDEDKKLIERDNRALGSIILALSTELYQNFEQHETAQGLCLRSQDCWSIPCMLIKNTTPDLKNKSLDDIIFLLESNELDAKKRTSDGSSGSKSEKGKGCCEHSSREKVRTTSQIPEDQIVLFGAFMSSYDALQRSIFKRLEKTSSSLVRELVLTKQNSDVITAKNLDILLMSVQKIRIRKLKDEEIENAENEFDEALMAEIEVSKKIAEVASDYALKSDDKGKAAVSTSEENSSDNEVTFDDDSFICSSDCIEKMQNYHAANTFLIAKKDKLKRDLTDKLIDAQSDLIKERVLISKWGMQRKILDNCVDKQRSCFIKDGVGYKAVPHPDHFEPFPEPHVSNDLHRDDNSNFLDLYVSATNNTGHVDEKVSVNDVRSFNEFNKVCILIVHIFLLILLTLCVMFSDWVSEGSSDSTFFDKVVHTTREYIPIHKMSCPLKDVVLDEFGNPLIQYYDLSHERPKKNNFIALENHILTSERENVKHVQIKISTPTKSQNVKGKSNDVKDKLIHVKDKPVQSKGKHMTGQREILNDFRSFEGGFVPFAGNIKGAKKCLFLKPGLVIPKEMIMMRAPRKFNTYMVDMNDHSTLVSISCLLSKATCSESYLWHCRMGHVNLKNMNNLVHKDLVRGLPRKEFIIQESCMSCAKGKHHKKSHPKKTVTTFILPLFLLHMDLFGPVRVKSIAKKSYCLVITDDFSRFSWVFFLASKDETPETIIKFIKRIENICDSKVSIIRKSSISPEQNGPEWVMIQSDNSEDITKSTQAQEEQLEISTTTDETEVQVPVTNDEPFVSEDQLEVSNVQAENDGQSNSFVLKKGFSLRIKHSYHVDKVFKTITIKCVSEKVGKIVIRVNLYKFNQVLFSTITDEVVTNLNVFSFGMFHRVICDRHGGIVVNEPWSSSVVQAVVSQLLLDLQDLRTTAHSSNVLYFTS
ncbi:hypothetical protein L1987_43215 [Smallanthus sonchifolius]|uniref:Uncharacterized protein n=1 Tax=Smallanthus sonchifolius TaxID=185202 RepID=A0ACB9GN23_9ASTR|nr:hypothetical protein L1987_43215 [Smallanthus sonchifolius]